MSKPNPYQSGPRAPIPRPPVWRWWHYPGHWLAQLKRLLGWAEPVTRTPKPAAPPRKWAGVLVLCLGAIVLAIGLALAITAAMDLRWPSVATWISLAAGGLLVLVGWMMLKSIESKLWACFFTFMTAALGSIALPSNSFALAANFAGFDLSVSAGQTLEATAPLVLFGGAGLALIGVIVHSKF